LPRGNCHPIATHHHGAQPEMGGGNCRQLPAIALPPIAPGNCRGGHTHASADVRAHTLRAPVHARTSIGNWIETTHADLSCEPGYVISHVVDHASNAIDFVEVFKWNTRKSRPQEVITEGFMAHSTHTAAGLASGTTDHAANLNPQCGDHLTDLHDHLTILTRSKPRRDELANVRKEEGREKWNEVRARIQTRWGSEHDECSTSNQSQYGIDVTIKRNVSPTGPDRDKYRAHMKEHGNLDKAIILQRSWEFFQQYEGAMQPVRDIIRWCQSARVIFHEELFEERRMFELISSPYF